MTDTPVLRQYREAKAEHPEGLLLFRLGDFFELFFEDAVVAAPILGVTLTSRPLGKSGRAPMCGVPQHSWQPYAGKLLRAGHRVVICDQVEAAGKGLVRRQVTRVLTPATVLEDAYLEPSRSNYLVAAWSRGPEAGLAACDVSAGELLLCQLPAESLPAELERWHPAELLSPPAFEDYRFDPDRGRQRLRDCLGISFPASVGADVAPLAVGAAGVVLEYLQANRHRLSPGILRVRTYSPAATMHLDEATRRNLELDALVRLLDRSETPMGARRLRGWVAAPLRDVEGIELRLEAVAELREAALAPALGDGLSRAGDLERLTTRAAHRLASARELLALRRGLHALPEVADALSGAQALGLRRLRAQVQPQPTLTTLLDAALIDEAAGATAGESLVRPGYDAELDRIIAAAREAREWIAALEARERERTGIRQLKVGFNRVFGYYIEVAQAHAASVPEEYIRKQTVTSAERYITPELKEREATVLNAERDFSAREAEVLSDLQDRVAEAAGGLLECADALADVDALRSLATVAFDMKWQRPRIAAGAVLEVDSGRHPIVEAALPSGSFVPNDLRLSPETQQVVVLTGPNMAGKSTYLRQCALIVLLAQCGSFVPADSALIGVVDRIFTRVGAHDDLVSGASTFMVEMTETANILQHATESSLLVLDEVGRGTSTYDGLSIAQAVLEYIHDRVRARTLFATHFHELTALADRLDRVSNFRMEVAEEGEIVKFLHRVVPGGADRSYGIHVAALAGLPSSVIQRARQVLGDLESRRPLEPADRQLELPLATAPSPLASEIEELDLDRLTPLEALQKLHEIQSRLAPT